MTKSSSFKNRYLWLLLGAAFIGWSAIFIYRSSFTIFSGERYFALFDDAMISLRYAWNLAHGYGLVWNPGQRIEGYTNPLMTFWMAPATLLFEKRYAVLAIQVGGIFFLLANAFLIRALAKEIFGYENRSHALLLEVLIFCSALAYYPFNYWTLMGMEIGLLATLLGLGMLFAFRYTRQMSFSYAAAFGLVAGLAYLARPDSALPAGIIFAYLLYEIYANKRGRIKHLFWAGGIYASFILGWEIFRVAYYGAWTPNTFVLKLTGLPLRERVQNGMIFVWPFFKSILVIYLVALAETIRRFSAQKAVLLAVPSIFILYQIWVGGDAWNYWRMMAAGLPLLTTLFILGLDTFFHWIERRYLAQNARFKQFQPWRIFLSVGLTIAMLLAINGRFLKEMVFVQKVYFQERNQGVTNVAIAIRDTTSPQAVLGVFWAGIIPYYTERAGIDFLGKMDPYIAHLPPQPVSWYGMSSTPGHNKFDLNYSIKQHRPTFVQRFFWAEQDLSTWGKRHYVLVDYQGVQLYYLKNSKDVLWDKVRILP